MAYEAKQYAQRNRQGSDWFSHDSNAISAKPACPEPAPETTEPAPVSEDVVDKSPTVESAASEPTAEPGAASAQPTRAQMIKPKCDSNDWLVLLCIIIVIRFIIVI